MAGGLPAAFQWRTGQPHSRARDGVKAERVVEADVSNEIPSKNNQITKVQVLIC
jgi:hypothetical protein